MKRRFCGVRVNRDRITVCDIGRRALKKQGAL